MKTGAEIPMKRWRMEQAVREQSSPTMVAKRLAIGLYQNLKIRRVNKRVVFVTVIENGNGN
jgi:hypothetical protein